MLYGNYTNRIKQIVAENRQRKNLMKSDSFTGYSGTAKDIRTLLNEQKSFSNKMQLNEQPLHSILKTTALTGATLGHPDFAHLKNSENTEYHYIVSAFIDIQGSTGLHKEYDLEDIFRITNTVQTAAIQTCLVVGGHVQRLQGDGVFVYFGGKNISKKEAVEMAVKACSMITYFVKNDLKNIFLEDGIEDINTRIGIDFGDDKDVMWANFGFMEVSELTTLSLHTSLASKMQGYARTNGIVVGQHIRDLLGVGEEMYSYVTNSRGEIIKRYIYEDNNKNFRYTQYNFDWLKYLKTLPIVGVNDDETLYLLDEEKERLERLRKTSSLLSSNSAYLNKKAEISSEPTGVKHEPHKFHYGK